MTNLNNKNRPLNITSVNLRIRVIVYRVCVRHSSSMSWQAKANNPWYIKS